MDRDNEYEKARKRLRKSSLPPKESAEAEAVALIHATFTAADPGVSPDLAANSDTLLAALTALRHVRQELASWEPRLIAAARSHRVSWAELAAALGVTSRQAAERRFLRLRPSATGEQTGEGRVRAERTRRAGDRAVTAWAQRNSSTLRQLAGQVSALNGLSTTARRRIALVHQALADADPSALLSPLARTHTHLPTAHAQLAEQIKLVVEHAESLRRTPNTGGRQQPSDGAPK